jgi:hypothetical protein
MRFFPLFGGWLKDVPPEQLEHEDPLEDLPAEKVDAIADSLARSIHDKGLSFPAALFLDIGRPLSFLASQAAIFVSPFLAPFVGEGKMNAASAFLGRRANVRKLVERLEQLHVEEKGKRKMKEAVRG